MLADSTHCFQPFQPSSELVEKVDQTRPNQKRLIPMEHSLNFALHAVFTILLTQESSSRSLIITLQSGNASSISSQKNRVIMRYVESGIRRMGSEITTLGSGISDHGIGFSSSFRDQGSGCTIFVGSGTKMGHAFV